jgi:hypothetical protein
MTHCRLVHSCRRFGEFPIPFSESKRSRTNLHSCYFISTPKMVTISTSGKSVTVDQSPCRYIPVDMNRHGQHCEKVIFNIVIACYNISKLCLIRVLIQKYPLINIVLCYWRLEAFMSQRTKLFDNSPFATPGVVMSLLSGSCIRPAKIQEEMRDVVQGGRKN